MSPIGGRQAFSGSFGAYLTIAVNLPSSSIGKIARLRWRLATDQSNGSPGWTVESVDCIPDSAWHYAKAPYPIPILDQSTTQMGGKVYGYCGVSAGVVIATSYRYDGVQWTQIGSLPVADAAIPDLPDARAAAATMNVPGGALIAGGLTGAFESGVTNTAIAWSSASNSWRSFPSLVAARGRTTGALLNGEPSLIGGCPYPCDFAGTRSVQVLADRIFANGFEQPN